MYARQTEAEKTKMVDEAKICHCMGLGDKVQWEVVGGENFAFNMDKARIIVYDQILPHILCLKQQVYSF